jgi:predicted RNase H-like nuclease (RuvC/YqgF family)
LRNERNKNEKLRADNLMLKSSVGPDAAVTISELTEECVNLREEIERLKAENEQLTKSIDSFVEHHEAETKGHARALKVVEAARRYMLKAAYCLDDQCYVVVARFESDYADLRLALAEFEGGSND